MNFNDEQLAVINSTEPYVLVEAGAGSGKAQPDYTLIPTPQGLKRLDELQVGDYVFDRFGKPTQILGVYPQGEKEIYEVEFSDKRVVECCDEHLWSYDNSKKGFAIKSLREMIDNGWKTKDSRGHNVYKYNVPNLCNPIEYEEKIVDIDPYILGCFIGDGCCLESRLTISSNDEELVAEIGRIGNFIYQKNSDNNYSWNFRTKNNTPIRTKEYFSKYLDELVTYCGNKRIPDVYLYNSYDNRMSLLQGLMDTDGTVADGRHSPSYSTTSKQLAIDVMNLSRSLGFYSTMSTLDRKDKKSIEYSVRIFTSNQNTHKIFRLGRKKNKALSFINNKQFHNHKFSTIRDIRATGKFTSMRCIYVDNKEHLYITSDYVVTHNTTCLVEKFKKMRDKGIDPNKMVAITFTNNAADEMKTRLGEYANDTFIGTIHSYCNYILRAYGVDTRNYLEKEDFDSLFQLVRDNPGCIREVDYLSCDEVQDQTAEQYDLILNYIKPKQWFMVGDIKQQIYTWNGADVTKFFELKQNSKVKTYFLRNNYRCGSKILEYARGIIHLAGKSYDDNSISTSGKVGTVRDVTYNSDTLCKGMIEWNKKKGDNWSDWFVLCRTNEEIDLIKKALQAYQIPCDTFKRKDLTREELNKRLTENTVKVLTIHAAKGLESKNVIVIGARFYNTEELCIAYVGATRAKELLIWARAPRKQKKITKNYMPITNWE